MIQIDIDMPEKCGLCPLFHAEHPMYCQGVKADRKKKIVAPYRDPRPEWCPLHEVTADTDTVSRQAAIESLYKEIIKRRLLDDVNDGMLDEFDTEDILRKLPSAQPQRTGRWIQIKEGIKVSEYKCSECGRTIWDDRGYNPHVDYPYCHCGARMEDVEC